METRVSPGYRRGKQSAPGTAHYLVPSMLGHNVLYSAVFEMFSHINYRCDLSLSLRANGDNERPTCRLLPQCDVQIGFSGEIRAMRPQ